MLKADLIKSIFEYRDTLIPQSMILVEEEKPHNWEMRPDVVTSPTENDKIPGFFSGKKVKVGAAVPEFVKEGEKIGNTFYNKSGKKYINKENPKKTEKEMSDKGTDINDLSILPGFGYAAMSYDEPAIKHLKTANIGVEDNLTPDKWSEKDLIELSKIIKKTPPQNWTPIHVDDFWVFDTSIRSGTNETTPVHLFDANATDSATAMVPFGFYTHFFTSIPDTETKSELDPSKVILRVSPHNRATANKPLTLTVHKLHNNWGVAAARLSDDQVILMKIPLKTIEFLKKV